MKLSPLEIFKAKKLLFIGGMGFMGKLVLLMLLSSLGGTVSAQQSLIPVGCPAINIQKTAAKANGPVTSERVASDKFVAEGQAATRPITGENLSKAISLYEKAIQTDPTNAQAYFFLARAHTQSKRYLGVPQKIAQARAWENLSKGRELEPGNIDGLHELADQVLANNRDYKCAEKIYKAALKIDPQNARSNFYLSQLLSGMGEFDLAFKYADKALEVADVNTRDFVTINAGRPRYMAGQYDWVLDHYQKYLRSNSNSPLAHFYLSLAFIAKGQFQQALVEAKLSMPNAPKGDAGGIGLLSLAYVNAGQKDKGLEMLNELLQRSARGEPVVKYRIAAVYEVLGERDDAFRWLNRAVDDENGIDSWLVWLNYDPVWKTARNDRRWNDIKKRAGW